MEEEERRLKEMKPAQAAFERAKMNAAGNNIESNSPAASTGN